jgi:hypothetical protein
MLSHSTSDLTAFLFDCSSIHWYVYMSIFFTNEMLFHEHSITSFRSQIKPNKPSHKSVMIRKHPLRDSFATKTNTISSTINYLINIKHPSWEYIHSLGIISKIVKFPTYSERLETVCMYYEELHRNAIASYFRYLLSQTIFLLFSCCS